MASKRRASPAFFLAINLFFFAFAAVHGCEPYCSNPATPPPFVAVQTSARFCPINALELNVCANVCANVLDLLKLHIGVPPAEQCCPLFHGLGNLDAAVCLCTAIKANVLGTNLNVPVDLNLLLNYCGKKCPPDFTCLLEI